MATHQSRKDESDKGNQIAWFCAEVAQHCVGKNIWFSIENPSGSIIWELPEYKALLTDARVAKVDFHACMFGSKRDKHTSFGTNCDGLEVLARSATDPIPTQRGASSGTKDGNLPPKRNASTHPSSAQQ